MLNDACSERSSIRQSSKPPISLICVDVSFSRPQRYRSTLGKHGGSSIDEQRTRFIGVAALGDPDLLIEIESTAVLI